MAVPAELLQVGTRQNHESSYALSLGRLKSVGKLALAETTEVQLLTGEVAQLRAEFDTSLSEMFKSDDEYGKDLEITRFDTYQTRGGCVLSHDGVAFISDMSKSGWRTSEAMSKQDPRMATQATRDELDFWNACEVDAMVQGKRPYNTRFVMSLLPEEAIQRDGADYWRELGYFPDTKTAFLQMYHVTTNGEVLQGTLSVDATDKSSMRKLWASLGVNIPEQTTTDTWLAHPSVGTMSAEEAKQCALSVRQTHYENVGHTPTKPLSVEEVLATNKTVVDQSFEDLHMSLAASVATSEKTVAIKELIGDFMALADQMSPEIRSALIRCHNRNNFDDGDARLVYKLIMYATAEKIRQSLRHDTTAIGSSTKQHTLVLLPQAVSMPPQQFIGTIVHAARSGIVERRAYGACGARISLSLTNEEIDPITGLSVEDKNDNTTDTDLTDLSEGKKRWMSCPHCKARVFDDPCAKVMSCRDCNALVVNGKVKSTGNGGSRKRRADAPKKSPAPVSDETSMVKRVNQVFKDRGISSFEQAQQKTAHLAGKLVLAGV